MEKQSDKNTSQKERENSCRDRDREGDKKSERDTHTHGDSGERQNAPCMDCIEPAPPATAGDMPSSDGVPPISSANDWCALLMDDAEEDEDEDEDETLP